MFYCRVVNGIDIVGVYPNRLHFHAGDATVAPVDGIMLDLQHTLYFHLYQLHQTKFRFDYLKLVNQEDPMEVTHDALGEMLLEQHHQ